MVVVVRIGFGLNQLSVEICRPYPSLARVSDMLPQTARKATESNLIAASIRDPRQAATDDLKFKVRSEVFPQLVFCKGDLDVRAP